MADPLNQIRELAAHTVELYGSVSGGSYVTGHAAAIDAREIMHEIDSITLITIYQCDECGKYHDHFDLCYYCGGEVTDVQLLSKRRKRGARK